MNTKICIQPYINLDKILVFLKIRYCFQPQLPLLLIKHVLFRVSTSAMYSRNKLISETTHTCAYTHIYTRARAHTRSARLHTMYTSFYATNNSFSLLNKLPFFIFLFIYFVRVMKKKGKSAEQNKAKY